MKILLIAHLSGELSHDDNDRFKFIANLLHANNNKVELITSDFYHHKKIYRTNNQKILFPYKITFVHEPYYKNNISLNRFYSHFIFGLNLYKYLKKIEKPDLIYCSFPPIFSTLIALVFSRRSNVKFVVDIQDLWPEAFYSVIGNNILTKIILFPLSLISDYIFKFSSRILAVSKTYEMRAKKHSLLSNNSNYYYLGTDLNKFDNSHHDITNFNFGNFIEIVYVGNLGHSYELDSIIKAIHLIMLKGIKNIRLVVIGDGLNRFKWNDLAIKLKINTIFTGRLSYVHLSSILKKCHIAVNPIKSNSPSSIINKVGDYAAAGLPVLSTQSSIEYRNLVDEFSIGFNCNNGDISDIASKLELLINDNVLRKKFGHNNRKLAELAFDRNVTYKQLVKFLID